MAMALSFLLVQSAWANLVVNGDFATGNTTGWTFTAAASGSDFFVGAIPIGGAVTGGYDSDPSAANFGAMGALDDTLSQVISTVAGQAYTFTFFLAHDSTNTANDFSAYWNGTAVLSLLNTATFDWTEYSYTETATGATTDITFAGREVFAWYDLDAVSVDPTTVPLPGTVVLLGSGLLLLLGWRRMQQV